jgi:hypothetical protein
MPKFLIFILFQIILINSIFAHNNPPDIQIAPLSRRFPDEPPSFSKNGDNFPPGQTPGPPSIRPFLLEENDERRMAKLLDRTKANLEEIGQINKPF